MIRLRRRRLYEARILRLQPGDVILVTPEGPLDETISDLIRAQVNEAFPRNKCVITSGLTVDVVRAGSA